MKKLNDSKPNRLPKRLAHKRINPFLILSSILLLSFVIMALPGVRARVTAAAQPQKGSAESQISESAQLQIKALLDEKESRTPAQQKIDSQLIYAGKMYRGQSIAAGIPTLEVNVGLESDGRVVVDMTANVIDEKLLAGIKAAGGEVLIVSEPYRSIRAKLPINQLETIAGFSQIRFIQPEQKAMVSQSARPSGNVSDQPAQAPGFEARAAQVREQLSDVLNNAILPNGTLSTGTFASEGDTTHRATTARGTFNVDGTGIKIGVLSNGVVSLAASQALGDLGTVTVLPGQTGSADEGTAMLEIVHDIAPGAQLFFATGLPTITQFAQNIRDLRTAGCDIIVDDLGYFVESPFQDGQTGVTNTNGGVVTQAVNDVVASGALYFSSAANSGNKNDNTSGTWEGDFVSGGALALIPGGGLVHDFDPSAAVAQNNLLTLGGGATSPVSIAWSDPLGGSSNDYDLFILNNAATTVVASSTNTQSGTQDPYEQTGSNTTNNRAVIRQKVGALNRFLHLSTNRGRLTFNTDGETHGHACATGGYGVAATPAYSPFNFAPPPVFGPFPAMYSTADKVETFSSDGPRRIFFNGNGTAITPGDFSSTGGQVLQQPLITAADGVAVTGVGGFASPFFGTSAAAPHAAAIAGLIKSANPSFTQAQIKTALTTTALDIEAAGTDRDSGFGTIMPYAALQSLGVTGKAFIEFGSATATETCCNLNGLIERGEGATLNIVLNNPGLLNATGITTTLATTTPGVNILNNTSAYADLAATSGTGTNVLPFSFSLATNSAVDVTITFTLTVNYTGGWNPSQVINFTVETGRKSITSTIDTTAPTTSTSFPATATNNQTARLFRADPASTCAVPHAFPGTSGAGNRRFDSYTLTNPASSPTVCVTVTLTIDKAATDFLQAVAYLGSFNPASLGTNFIADIGASPSIGYAKSLSFNLASGATVVIIVNETTAAGTGTNTPYTLRVAGIPITAAPTLAKVGSFDAINANDGRVLLKWNSTYEVENLGYNVYREVAGQRTKVNPQLIAGSALITGDKVALSSGKGYAWADQPQSTATARYFLEAVDLKGQSTWTGPVSVKAFSGSPAANLEQSALLTRIGLAQAQMTLGQGSTPAETRAPVAEPSAAGLQIQSGLASQASVKIAVRREGWYRISQSDLLAAGLDPRVDPRNLQLYVDGRTVPMIVNGEQTGRVESIEFYGIGLNSPSTDAHVYWLAATTQPGTRIKAVKASGGTATAASFPYTVERKDRTLYFSGLKNGDTENFFGPVVTGVGTDQSLTLTGLAAGSAAANLEVSLQGVTALDHQVRVMLNGANVGTMNFTGQAQGKASFALSQSQLREGINSVQLTALGGTSDISITESVRITYQRKYTADNNALQLSASGGQQLTIGGFSSTAIRVMDVTDPNSAQELTGSVLGGKASGSITFTVPGTGSRALYAFAADRTLSVTPKANTPSNLRGGGQAADYIMITTGEMAASLNPLKALRQSQGLAVVVVNVEDIYDEFSYGNKNPQAVKDFLVFANSSWGRGLRFVLFAGDASYDPKNYLGYGDSDLVPTKLYDSGYMEAATDDYFVDFDENNVPDVAVGRLPVRNATEAAAAVGKIVRYESSVGSNSVLLASDTGEGFSAVNTALRGLLPSGVGVNEINRGSADDSTVRNQLLAAINAGQKIVNYNGHGSVTLLRGNILMGSDAAGMTNSQKLSVFVLMTCLNGYFNDPVAESLSESVMKANAGAAGAWASAAQCEPSGQAIMNQELYRLLFDGSGLTLGEATAKAKAKVSDVDVRRSWIYFGDPAMKLK
jgi:hypothetical protein